MNQAITHAILLVGGIGTRLQSVVSDLPKPMAPIAGKPFLAYQLDYLIDQGIESITLCTGHLSDSIEEYFGSKYQDLQLDYSIETQPLGTGGAIKKALENFGSAQTYVLNGDSYFEVDLRAMAHEHTSADLSIALKKQEDTNRYGTVRFNDDFKIIDFKEKQVDTAGWINGGIYLIKKSILEDFPEDEKFSFEAFISSYAPSHNVRAFLSKSYFIDIGIPSDLEIAQRELPLITYRRLRGWTLFLDRDGVINVRTPGTYVKSWDEWEYCEGALAAIKKLSYLFDRIVVVTNQQGVGLHQMSHYDLSMIHHRLHVDVQDAGGYIHKCYASTDLKEKSNNSRKPNPKMGHWAQRDFPEIDFARSIIVGDSATDIEFGQVLGMKTAAISGKPEDETDIMALSPDWQFDSLSDFAAQILDLL